MTLVEGIGDGPGDGLALGLGRCMMRCSTLRLGCRQRGGTRGGVRAVGCAGPKALFAGSILNHEGPKVSVTVEDADGRTAEWVADALLIERTPTQVAGKEAVHLDRIPGQDFYRRVVAGHEGCLYVFQFFPMDEELESYERAVVLCDPVMGSLHFVDIK
jgi:hypothetical protein